MQPRLGIALSYNIWDTSNSKMIQFDAVVKTGTPTKQFITNPLVRKALEEIGLKDGTPMGYITYEYFPHAGTVKCRQYYPFPHKNDVPNPRFVGKGLAQMIEEKTLSKFSEIFPHAKTVLGNLPSEYRITQLEKRGLLPTEILDSVSFQRHRNALRQKLAGDLRKARTKRFLPRAHK